MAIERNRAGVYRRGSMTAGVVLGLGIGGFLDGILLHQIMHWHNMGSAVLPPVDLESLQTNMIWDGYFHLATLMLVVAGVFLLLGKARGGAQLPTPGVLTGQMLLGWGVFNLVEGVIDHHILQIHHVRDLPVHEPIADWIFLAVGGVGLIVLGWWIARERPAR
jgi:uncharacterized membrane protein